jgi:uncharacterized protein YpmS
VSGFIKAATIFLLLALPGVCLVLFLIVDSNPEIQNSDPLPPAKLQQTLAFIEKSDPRALQPGTDTSLTLREEDLDLFLNYILDNYKAGAGKVSISQGMITVLASVKIPTAILDRYVNLQIALSTDEQALQVDSFRLGKVPIPRSMTRIVVNLLNRELIRKVPEYAEISSAITGYEIANSSMVISYRWQPELIGHLSSRGSDLFIDEEAKERLMIYNRRLAEIAGAPELPRTISLARIVSPMMGFAASRNGDPIKENRAAIMAMALYVMDVDVSQIFGNSASVPAIQSHRITLSGRQDFAKHFLTSAAIAISADTNIADSFGLMKEMDDATAGSGFSFTDVGADRAGVRFAEFATSNPQNAVLLQQKLSGEVAEDIFVPDLRDLPEFMPQAEFSEKYGGINQPEFQRVIADIEERISQLSLFKPL